MAACRAALYAFGAEQQPVDLRVDLLAAILRSTAAKPIPEPIPDPIPNPKPSKTYLKPKTYNRFNSSTELSKMASKQP